MYDFGTIVLVPFPFTDLSSSKVRPALIVSANRGKQSDVIVCFISSKPSRGSLSFSLPADSHTGLKVRSTVRLDKIATLSKEVILGELGRASVETLRTHRKNFFDVFGF